MSVKIASLYAEISADNSKLNNALGQSKAGLSDFGAGLLKGVGRLVGITSAAAIAGLAIKGLKLSLDAAAESQTGLTRLNATLAATGRGAEISANQIDKMAVSLMNVSTFDDEAIVAAYNTLMKFDSIPIGNMEQIVKTAMDMSAAMGGDLVSNADALGRALETGVIPRSWGFSAALKEQFKAQVDAGDSAGALTLMMDELNKRYGGQAVAQLDTYAGSTAALKVSMENLWEAIGEGLLDEGQTWNEWIKENVDTITRAVPKVYAYIDALNFARRQAGPRPLFDVTEIKASNRALDEYNQKVQRLMREYQAGLQTHEAWDSYLESEQLGARQLADGIDLAAEAAAGLQNVISRTNWEVMYTNADVAAERTKIAFDYVGDKLQELGEDGANVWSGYLVATGQISSQAIEQFIKIELAYDSLRRMIDSKKFTIDFMINVFTQQMDVATGATTTTAAPASTAYWIPDPSNPGHYMVNPDRKASGGDVRAGGWAIVGDDISGRRTGYEEAIHALPGGGVRVYPNSQTRGMSAPPMASGGVVPPTKDTIKLDPESIRELAFAFKVELAAVL